MYVDRTVCLKLLYKNCLKLLYKNRQLSDSSLQKQNLSPGRLKLSKNAEKLLSKEELLQEVKKENT